MPDRDLGFLVAADRAALAATTRLACSFRQYNRDGLTLFVVVPDEEAGAYAAVASDEVRILPLSALGTADPRPGVVNLAFWELDLVDVYATLPTGLEFLRPFGRSDFLHADGVPYLFASAERELRTDPLAGLALALERERVRSVVADSLGGGGQPGDVYEGPAVLSATVLRTLRTDYIEPAERHYPDLIDECADAAVWHNTWLRRTRVMPFELREPVVRILRTDAQLETYRALRVGNSDLARGYVALVNTTGRTLEPEIPRYRQVGSAMPMRDLRRALSLRLLRRAPRVQRLLGLDLNG